MKKNIKVNVSKAVAVAGILGFVGGAYVEGSNLLVHDVMASTTVANADATITFNGNKATGSGSGYTVKNNTVTITEGGTYVLKGTGENVQVLVEAAEEDVTLILNGVTLSNETDAPIFVSKANSVTINLADGTTNTLSDAEAKEEITDENERTANAVIYSKASLTIDGKGKLLVDANYKNAITSKDDLVIKNGNFEIKTVNNGFVGKDSLTVVDGTFNITAGGDGFQSDNTDENKGFVTIENGTFSITAANDAIQAESTLTINNGDFNLTTGGGSEANTDTHAEAFGGGMGKGTTTGAVPNGQPPAIPGEMQFDANGKPMGTPETAASNSTDASTSASTNTNGKPPELPGEMQFDANGKPVGGPNVTTGTTGGTTDTVTDTATTEEETTSDSYKGLKANNVVINNGTFVIDSNDDAIHGNTNVTINDGKFTISSGDDAIHAENINQINGGEIEILTCYEGIEGFKIEINGGDIDLTSTDDALNAASATSTGFGGGMGMGATSYNEETDPSITINDGTLYLNSSSDTLDSNGALFINGGDIYVNGPKSGAETSLDFDKYAEIDGGNLIAVGGTSNMFSNFATTSEQVAFAYFYTSEQSAGSKVQVLDSKGNVVAEIEPARNYTSVVVSSPDLVKGATYTIKNGSSTQTITLSSTETVTTSGYTGGGTQTGGRGAKTGTTTGTTTQQSKTVKTTV